MITVKNAKKNGKIDDNLFLLVIGKKSIHISRNEAIKLRLDTIKALLRTEGKTL